jgi:serine/threonine-protein kinase
VGVPLAVFIVRELLSALHAVHEACGEDGQPLAIVHRDVSPSNVLLSMHGDVKLGDFGIAYAELRENLPHTVINARAKGKLGYLAPEQVTGIECDRRADVFGAGVIAAELLMGRPLFTGGSELAVLLAIRDARIHPFREQAHNLPPGLPEVVEAALARDRDERIGSAAELSERLEPYQYEQESVLRRTLGHIVATAMKVVEEDAEVEPTPLTEEQELAPPGITKRLKTADSATPIDIDLENDPNLAPTSPGEVGVDGMLAFDRESETEDRETISPPREGPDTGKIPTAQYLVTTTDGKRFGPWPFAQLVEALAIGKIGAGDSIRLQGQREAQRIADVPILARHVPRTSLTPATRDQMGAPEPDEVVPLAHGGMIHALVWTVVLKRTGLWLCELGGVRKEVYVQRGVPEFVTSNLAGELLGEYLVANGVITRGELDMALAVMPRFEGRLGDTLAALGLVEPVHLFQHIAAQVREKLLDLFLWEAGQGAFYDGVMSPPSAFPLGLDPWKILDEGARRRISQGLEDERFEGMDEATIVRVDSPPAGFDVARLPGEVHAVYQALSRPMTLGVLEQSFPDVTRSGGYRARRALLLLFHLDAIRWE